MPVGREITDLRTCATLPQTRPWLADLPKCDGRGLAPASATDTAEDAAKLGRGSIVVIVATDAPLVQPPAQAGGPPGGDGPGQARELGRQLVGRPLPRLLHREPGRRDDHRPGQARRWCPNEQINPFFRATIDATEEAVVNAMLAAPPVMTGADGLRIYGLPGDRLVAAMKKYGRMK